MRFRMLGALGAASLLLPALAWPNDSLPAASPADGPKSVFWGRRLTGYISAADGVPLRYSVLLPKGKGPFPTILLYSGYDTGQIGGTAYLNNDVTFSVDLDQTLVEHGYAVIGVNARATGCSEGEPFNFLGAKYGEDGRDAVEFAASQFWSNGAVGMVGWSWAGMSQLATAALRPPHLKAVAPGMVLGDVRLDNGAPGGVPNFAFAAGWHEYLRQRWDAARTNAEGEHDTRCLEQLKRNLAGEQVHSWVSELLRHPLRDPWTQTQQLSDRSGLIQVPLLSMESFQDEAVTSREAYYQETLNPDKVWMVQTNGSHDMYESLAFRKVLLPFLDHFVKGERNGFEKGSHLTVWMESTSTGQGPHGYVEAAVPGWLLTRPTISPAITPISFVLNNKGRLLLTGTGEGEADTFEYPMPGPAVDIEPEHDAWGPLAPTWRKGSLAYTSPPLSQDVPAYGSASADLWVSSTAPDADVQVTLTEVRATGEEIFIQRGWLRLSDRAIDPLRSTKVRPVLIDAAETVQPLESGQPVVARVELNKFAWVFRQHSKIRIWVDTPSPTGEYTFAHVSLPATNKIWHDATHPSQLVLGKLEGVETARAAPDCGTVIKQPCRRDPLAD